MIPLSVVNERQLRRLLTARSRLITRLITEIGNWDDSDDEEISEMLRHIGTLTNLIEQTQRIGQLMGYEERRDDDD